MKNTKAKNSVLVELHDWPVSKRKDDRIGRVIKSKTINVEELAGLVATRKPGLDVNTLKAGFELMKEMAIEEILNGASVDFGIGHFQLNVKGIFVGDQAKWDDNQHSLSLKTTPSRELKKAMGTCEVKVRGRANSSITINEVKDLSSGLVNQCLTPGGPVDISGTHLKLVGDQTEVGLKLLNCDTKEVTQIPGSAIMQNVPRSIKFVVPVSLDPGHYQLILVSQFTSKGAYLKEARTYTFHQVFELS